jgi:hypothetical protein
MVLLSSFFSIQSIAQSDDGAKKEGMKKIKALYIAYMTKELSLNEKQVQEIRTLVAKEVEKREANRAEMEAKKAAGYFTPGTVKKKKELKKVKGRGLYE